MKTHEAISILLGYTQQEDKNPPAEVIKAIGHIIRLEDKKEVEENTDSNFEKMEEEKEKERLKKEFAEVRDAILHYVTYSQIINGSWVKQYNHTLHNIKELEGTTE
jgi:hypothetical protein